ncbi:MAG: AlpA family phage regulatory protein, partial [Desulfobulbia bacterium]
VQIGPRRVAWRQSEIEDWKAEKIRNQKCEAHISETSA